MYLPILLLYECNTHKSNKKLHVEKIRRVAFAEMMANALPAQLLAKHFSLSLDSTFIVIRYKVKYKMKKLASILDASFFL